MKLDYRKQLVLTCLLILGGNGLNMWLRHWFFTSAGRFLAGLLWVINPVMADGTSPSGKQVWIIRSVGIFLMLCGIFGRLYLY